MTPDSTITADSMITAAAQRLQTVERTRVPCAPIREFIGADDIDAAYAVQQVLVADRLAGGARIVGRKIGLTSPAVQAQLGVDRPDFGFLFADMDVTASGIGADALLQPKAEAEVAFVLARDLDSAELDLDTVRDAIESSWAALEIVDSRIAGWDIRFADTVADNASSGLYVLGDRLPADVTPVDVAMTMSVNGEIVSTGSGDACLGDPLNALLWLAETARDHGRPLTAGQVILSGALGPMAQIGPGDRIEASLSVDGSPVATVATHVEPEHTA
ncbi:MAG: fumarylacetoacetate hydrolase family protein [Gordonia amarae]